MRAKSLLAFGAVVLACLVASGCGSRDAPRVYVQPVVEQGVEPSRSAREVEDTVARFLDPDARIIRVRVVANSRQFRQTKGGPVWIVRAYGHFQFVTVPPGRTEPIRAFAGWVALDDRTGHVIAYGWSHKKRTE